jgi:ATP-dependent DNA ligase
VQEIGLEGVVGKTLSQRYKPGERLWVKVKNRDYWRFPLERDAVIRARTLRDSLGGFGPGSSHTAGERRRERCRTPDLEEGRSGGD